MESNKLWTEQSLIRYSQTNGMSRYQKYMFNQCYTNLEKNREDSKQ